MPDHAQIREHFDNGAEALREVLEAASRALDADDRSAFVYDKFKASEAILTDIANLAPKVGATAAVLRHYLPDRADAAERPVEGRARHSGRYFMLWPDGETIGFGHHQRPSALRKLGIKRREYPETRLYDAREGAFIDHEEEA